MDFYAPIFSKIVDSSLWDEEDYVVKVFLTMLAKKDADHVVRATAYAIGRWSRKTEKEVLEALKILSRPDKNRLEPQPYDGRRIVKLEEGWLVVNGKYYKELAQQVSERARKARWAREHRSKVPKDNRDDMIRIERANAAANTKIADQLEAEKDAEIRKAAESNGPMEGDW